MWTIFRQFSELTCCTLFTFSTNSRGELSWKSHLKILKVLCTFLFSVRTSTLTSTFLVAFPPPPPPPPPSPFPVKLVNMFVVLFPPEPKGVDCNGKHSTVLSFFCLTLIFHLLESVKHRAPLFPRVSAYCVFQQQRQLKGSLIRQFPILLTLGAAHTVSFSCSETLLYCIWSGMIDWQFSFCEPSFSTGERPLRYHLLLMPKPMHRWCKSEPGFDPGSDLHQHRNRERYTWATTPRLRLLWG